MRITENHEIYLKCYVELIGNLKRTFLKISLKIQANFFMREHPAHLTLQKNFFVPIFRIAFLLVSKEDEYKRHLHIG